MVCDKKTDRTRAICRHFLSDRMLPVSENDFYGSEWQEWLDRINAGFELEKKRLEKLADGASEKYAESLADYYWQAEQISGNMYAALIVSVWAKIEHFFKNLCGYCECFGLPPIGEKPNIETYARYFHENLGVDLQLIINRHETNMLRVLSNSFKHNDCRYHPDSFPIEQTLGTKYGITEDRPVRFSSLPIKELILNAGAFCQELLNKADTVLKQQADEK